MLAIIRKISQRESEGKRSLVVVGTSVVSRDKLDRCRRDLKAAGTAAAREIRSSTAPRAVFLTPPPSPSPSTPEVLQIPERVALSYWNYVDGAFDRKNWQSDGDGKPTLPASTHASKKNFYALCCGIRAEWTKGNDEGARRLLRAAKAQIRRIMVKENPLSILALRNGAFFLLRLQGPTKLGLSVVWSLLTDAATVSREALGEHDPRSEIFGRLAHPACSDIPRCLIVLLRACADIFKGHFGPFNSQTMDYQAREASKESLIQLSSDADSKLGPANYLSRKLQANLSRKRRETQEYREAAELATDALSHSSTAQRGESSDEDWYQETDLQLELVRAQFSMKTTEEARHSLSRLLDLIAAGFSRSDRSAKHAAIFWCLLSDELPQWEPLNGHLELADKVQDIVRLDEKWRDGLRAWADDRDLIC